MRSVEKNHFGKGTRDLQVAVKAKYLQLKYVQAPKTSSASPTNSMTAAVQGHKKKEKDV